MLASWTGVESDNFLGRPETGHFTQHTNDLSVATLERGANYVQFWPSKYITWLLRGKTQRGEEK